MVRELLKFHATWCAPCKRVGTQLEELGVRTVNLDVEENADKASEFNVMSVPVLVVLQDGEEIGRHTNSAPDGVRDFLAEYDLI